MEKLGYYSLSMGAYFGPIPARARAAHQSGGLRIQAASVMMLSAGDPTGELRAAREDSRVAGQRQDDFAVSGEERQRFYELLGTPVPLKKPSCSKAAMCRRTSAGLFREVLAWYDTHLGVVK